MAELVLVVDDNLMNQRLLGTLLALAGYEVEYAADADQARTVVNRRTPRLILMDLQLPRVDGLTLTAEFKARDDLRAVPIVAVTASAMRGDEERARSAGCDGYISKPIDTRTFAKQVAGYFQTGE